MAAGDTVALDVGTVEVRRVDKGIATAVRLRLSRPAEVPSGGDHPRRGDPSVTLTIESERTVTFGLWVISVSFGIPSIIGFIIAAYSSREYVLDSTVPFASSVIIVTGKSTQASPCAAARPPSSPAAPHTWSPGPR